MKAQYHSKERIMAKAELARILEMLVPAHRIKYQYLLYYLLPHSTRYLTLSGD